MKREKSFKALACGLISVVLIVAGLWFLQRLLMPKYISENEEGLLSGEYYANAGDNDVLFIGDCEVYSNFSTIKLWEDYGITSVIRGTPQQLIWQSYYMLKDTLRYETPKVVVYNVYAMQYDKPRNEAYNRLTLDGMRWSSVKSDAIKASMTEEEMLELLAEDGMLVKRPILVTDRAVLVGFREAEWEAALL